MLHYSRVALKRLFFHVPFLAPFIVFPILFHHACIATFGPAQFISSFHPSSVSSSMCSTNGAAESRSVAFRTTLALFPPSVSSEALLQQPECVQCNLAALEQIEIRIEPM